MPTGRLGVGTPTGGSPVPPDDPGLPRVLQDAGNLKQLKAEGRLAGDNVNHQRYQTAAAAPGVCGAPLPAADTVIAVCYSDGMPN